jgi:hypothetical protein
MKVRYKEKPHITGSASDFNTHSASEVLVHFHGGDAASVFIRDLQVELVTGWKDLKQAFADQDLVPDNYNTWFGVPNAEQKARGYI